jgi:integrase
VTAANKASRPKKPSKTYPLYSHRNGQWAKKVNGKTCFFGSWADPAAAEKRFRDEIDDIRAGRPPQLRRAGQLTVRDLVNNFLDARRQSMEAGELSALTWRDYYRTCGRLVQLLGKTREVRSLQPNDFKQLRAGMAEGRSAVTLQVEISKVKAIFRYAHDDGLIDTPVHFGASFKRPPQKVIRLERARRPARMFEAAELLKILDAARQPMRAMIFLGVGCGYGNHDVAKLPIEAVDLDSGWVEFARPKTGIPRRCPLWAETVEAIEEAIGDRRSGPAFLTSKGRPLATETRNCVGDQFRRLLTKLGLRKEGRGFYSLRHVFATIGSGCLDQIAVDHVMGHAERGAPAQYRARVDDSRLLAVSNHVKNWLFGENG